MTETPPTYTTTNAPVAAPTLEAQLEQAERRVKELLEAREKWAELHYEDEKRIKELEAQLSQAVERIADLESMVARLRAELARYQGQS